MSGKIEIFQGKKNKQWYFRLKASNGQIVCQSEGYTRKQNCAQSANRLGDIAVGARVVEL